MEKDSAIRSELLQKAHADFDPFNIIIWFAYHKCLWHVAKFFRLALLQLKKLRSMQNLKVYFF